VEIASDIIAFALGLSAFSDLSTYKPEDLPVSSHVRSTLSTIPLGAIHQRSAPAQIQRAPQPDAPPAVDPPKREQKESRIVTVVCPSRDLAYPISLVKELGVDTVTADFGQFNTGDLLKSAAKWIDLSDSETIWRE